MGLRGGHGERLVKDMMLVSELSLESIKLTELATTQLNITLHCLPFHLLSSHSPEIAASNGALACRQLGYFSREFRVTQNAKKM